MKKLICAALLLLFAFSLCSCGGHELYGREISAEEMPEMYYKLKQKRHADRF